MNRYAPTERKVTAATIAAAVTTLLLYLLSLVPFVADMPPFVYGAVVVLVTGLATYVVGWLAPHTPRPGDTGPYDPDGGPSAYRPEHRRDVSPTSTPHDDGRALRGYTEPHGRLAG